MSAPTMGLISAVTNKGELRWMPLDGAIKAPVLIRFMQRLVQETGRKVFLVLDYLPVHRARLVQDWLAEHTTKIEIFHLPPYNPEINPDEGLNADLNRNVISHMRSLSKRPDRIRSYFGHHTFRYAT